MRCQEQRIHIHELSLMNHTSPTILDFAADMNHQEESPTNNGFTRDKDTKKQKCIIWNYCKNIPPVMIQYLL